ncbi:unnamed protein product [Arctia plantaginis]|uniref:Uncharacterized protein n=1 Tax=Arctia plantaginis TaxID=874455 RepID=A0A8S0ZDH2_ARCPL|nr:unnamed protein product [Arctia plantaginis]
MGDDEGFIRDVIGVIIGIFWGRVHAPRGVKVTCCGCGIQRARRDAASQPVDSARRERGPAAHRFHPRTCAIDAYTSPISRLCTWRENTQFM